MISSEKIIKRSKFIGLEGINFILKPIQTSLISLLIIRLFQIELWGEFVFFLVAVELSLTVLSWGQKPFLLREFSLMPKDINSLWLRSVLARLPLVLVAAFLFLIIPQFQEYFLPLIIWVFLKWLCFQFDALIQFYRKYWLAIISDVVSISVALLLIYFFSESMNIEKLIYVFALSSLSKGLLLLSLLKTTGISISSVKWKAMKEELKKSFPFFALSIVGLLQTKGDLFVVTYLLDGVELASYQVLIGFLIIGQTFSAIVLGPFQKNLYRLPQMNIKKVKKTYVTIGLVSSVLMSLAIYWVLTYLYQLELLLWHIPLFVAYLFVLFTCLIECQIMLKNKNEKQLINYNLIAALCNITISLFLVPYYGIYGALVSGIVCRVFLSMLIVNWFKKLKKSTLDFETKNQF